MTKNKEITVLAVPVGQRSQAIAIPGDHDGSYKWLCGFVDGRISSKNIAQNLDLISNEQGLAEGLPYNRCGFVGNFVISKYSSAGNMISMTDADLDMARAWLARNRHLPPRCHACGALGGATLFCPCRDVLIYCVACYDKLGDVMNGSDEAAKRRYCLCERCRRRNNHEK